MVKEFHNLMATESSSHCQWKLANCVYS